MARLRLAERKSFLRGENENLFAVIRSHGLSRPLAHAGRLGQMVDNDAMSSRDGPHVPDRDGRPFSLAEKLSGTPGSRFDNPTPRAIDSITPT